MVRFTKKLTLPNNEDVIPNSITQTRVKWNFLVLHIPLSFDWCSVDSFFFFLFRPNVKKGYLDEKTFCHCYGNFLERVILKSTWSQLCSEFLLYSYEAN